MSAFIVDIECMDRVVRGLVLVADLLDPAADPTTIGRDLFQLNVEAVRQRYGNDIEDMMPATGWKPNDYRYTEPPVVPGCPPLVDSLKALHCLLYQCSEGTVRNEPLYEALEAAGAKLELAIRATTLWRGDIENMPAYKLASW
jgi:hypothetical protein